jgi:hypothetical protein
MNPPRSFVAALVVAIAIGAAAGLVTVMVDLDPGATIVTVVAATVAVLVMWLFQQ